MMAIEIITAYKDVSQYIESVRKLADRNKASFAFLPEIAYENAASKGCLWIVRDSIELQMKGYLFFGGTFPTLKVFQICVHPNSRSQGIAAKLIEELKNYGETHNFMHITARVASELDANHFWRQMGFKIIEQSPGKTKNRTINRYCLDLDVPSLFSSSPTLVSSLYEQSEPVISPPKPILESPSFAIDVNFLLDIVRNRNNSKAASILTSAMNNEIKLCVTHQFINELQNKSTNTNNDPLLAFAKQLPRLHKLSNEILSPLVENIRPLFSSGTPKTGKRLTNDQSDFIHLASCIHHGVHGFITRDGLILRNAQNIYDKYGLRIYSPDDLIDSYEDELTRAHESFSVERQEIIFSKLREDERVEFERFLLELGVNKNEIDIVLDPGIEQFPRSRLVARATGSIFGICSWSNNVGPSRENSVHLYVDEQCPNVDSVIDHFLESAINSGEYDKLRIIDLKIIPKQIRTQKTAIIRGFQTLEENQRNYKRLRKISVRGVITNTKWRTFIADLRRSTFLELPDQMPNYEVARNTGLVGRRSDKGEPFQRSLFDFEVLISPGYIVSSGRSAIMIPIRENYATELFGHAVPERQSSFLSKQEAALRLERAYFSSNTNKHIEKGTIVIFYVSSPRNEAVAMARVTFVDELTKTRARLTLGRQGVLSENELNDIANAKGNVFAFTFDNLLAFPNPISYRDLKQIGCGRANFITSERLQYHLLQTVIDKAFE